MQVTHCGLDFGTSNSTFGLVDRNGEPRLVSLEDDQDLLPSVLFFNFEDDKTYFGRAAIAQYVEGADGRMLRALKSILGSALMNDETRIKARRIPFTEILTTFLSEIRARAEHAEAASFENVVAGRPVHFVDGDEAADRLAQQQLETAIRGLGFRNIAFQFEPIAAALDYERRISREELALVVDVGGGTSDFTIVRLSPARATTTERASDILATAGVHVGGTDFDRHLSMAKVMPLLGHGSRTLTGNRNLPIGPYYDLATWHRINRLYTRQTTSDLRSMRREAARPERIEKLIEIVAGRHGHRLAAHVEDAKIALTSKQHIEFRFDAAGLSLVSSLDRRGLEEAIAQDVARIPAAISDMLKAAGIAAADIQTIITTGGSTQIPAVRRGFDRMFENADYVDMNAFGSVGLGLALDASRRF